MMDRIIKISGWPQAIVAVVGLLAVTAIVVALILAGWSAEAIVGFGILAAGLFTTQAVNARKVSTVEAKTDDQTSKLNTIVRQTNGISDTERTRLADEAAVKAVEAYRRAEAGGHQ